MRTFKDLQFYEHESVAAYRAIGVKKHALHAVMNFENGYGVSVVCGEDYYSNGVDTYEVAILKDGDICYDTPITDDVLANLTESEVTEIIERVQMY